MSMDIHAKLSNLGFDTTDVDEEPTPTSIEVSDEKVMEAAGLDPFGEQEEEKSIVTIESTIPVLYTEKSKTDMISLKSALLYRLKENGDFYSTGDEYFYIYDGKKEIPKESIVLNIKEKDKILIEGTEKAIKVTKPIAALFDKISLGVKMKLGSTIEAPAQYVPKKEVLDQVFEEGRKERELGLLGLYEKINIDSSSGSLYDFLKVYAFKKHVLVSGPAGHGKTYTVDKFAKDNGATVLFKSLDEGTESIDLLGHMIKLSNGSFAWKDGILTQAFRLAENSKVILFLDEMLRAPVKELNILIGSLTPNSNEEFVLRTGRPLEDSESATTGLVEEEILKVPMENLWIVSSTNQGAGYNTGRIDRAMKDRFRLYYQEATRDEIEEIIYDKLLKKLGSESQAKNVSGLMLAIMDEISEMVDTGNLPERISLRHMSEAIDTADNIKDIKKRMLDITPNICSITSEGKFNEAQMEIIQSIINSKL